jgi:hypothetical protein
VEKPPETCRTSTVIKNIEKVASCWLYLKEYFLNVGIHISKEEELFGALEESNLVGAELFLNSW